MSERPADVAAPVAPGRGSRIVHLSARFFTSLSPAPPPVEVETWVDQRLLPGERALWMRLSNQDRRHSALVGQRFEQMMPDAPRSLIAGAILHDVGKIDCGLGTFARVVATVAGPGHKRFAVYHHHEEIGAAMAAAAGSDPATVELIAGEGVAFETLKACDHA